MVLSESHVQIHWGSILFYTIKKSDFYLGNGILVTNQPKCPLQKKTNHNMHPQLIKMNLQEENMVINVVELSIK
jgi:hypothetical protein